jgi:hypothetical protein
MSTAAVKRYWDRVAALGCCICSAPAEIAHCHGGSMVPIMGPHAKGKKVPRFDWLVLPLCPKHGREQFGGLDANVRDWERRFGTQLVHLLRLSTDLDVNIWAHARVPAPCWNVA